MVKKIALTGAHGTGKTTLVTAVMEEIKQKNHLSIIVIPEIPRLICELAKDPAFLRRGKNTLLKQTLILQAQVQVEVKKMNQQGVDFLFCDRALLDHWAYTKYLFGGMLEKEGVLKLYEQLIADYSLTYDKLFYIPIEFPPLDDGIREDDRIFQNLIDNLITRFLLTYRLSFITVSGNIEERCKKVIQELELLQVQR